MTKKQLAVIGLDGIRLDIVERFSDDLPFLRELLQEGARGPLETVLPGPHSGPAWTSFSTGLNPGKHGIGDWRIRDGYNFIPASGEDIPHYRFWDYLSDAGYTVGVFNIPMTSPPYPLDGVLVTSWAQAGGEYAYPASFQQDLESVGYQRKAEFSDPNDKLENLYSSIEGKRKGIELFLKKYDWNLLVGMFYETEQAHHQFASFLDPDHPEYHSEYESRVRSVYVKVDEELRALNETLGDTPLIILSDHGFCPLYERIHLNRILEEMGYYSPIREREDRDIPIRQRILVRLIRAIRDNDLVRTIGKRSTTLPVIGGFVERAVDDFRSIEYSKEVTSDWKNTQAFNGYEHGGIFLNTIDKPEGIVSESEREELVDDIIDDMRNDAFLDSRIEGVYRREELFDGERLSMLPEIIVNFADGYLGSSGYDERRSRGPDELSNIGFHTLEGAFLAKGPDIAAGAVEGANILDIAPTVLHYFGEPVPENIDGEVLFRIFDPDADVNERDTVIGEPKFTDRNPVMTRDERQAVETRLREMGYR